MTILVLGATGKTGRHVLRRLREQGEKVRAGSRTAETRFDWDDSGSWANAVRDIESVYLIAPDDPAPIEAFVEQAVAFGVRRFVVLSGRGIEKVDGSFGGMVEAERAVRASAAEWTILRANNFDQNFDEDLWRAPLLAGRLALPAAEVGEPFLDVEDVGEVAAAVLTRPGHEGRIYDLSGPDSLTFAQATEAISTASGRPIAYVELTPAEYRAELQAEGWPAEAVDSVNAMFDLMRQGHLAEPADGVREVLGREAGSFADYVARAWRP
jgi:uncharacterized protein YbjT (DUF2867 family)